MCKKKKYTKHRSNYHKNDDSKVLNFILNRFAKLYDFTLGALKRSFNEMWR